MNDTSTQQSQFETLQADYTAWMAQVLTAVFYEPLESRRVVVAPPSFRLAGQGDHPSNTLPTKVLDTQDLLHDLAKSLLDSPSKPSLEQFESFFSSLDSFLDILRQLERENVLEGFGIDSLTGLRSQSVMIPELEKELERRARRGQPFSIVVTRIDDEAARSVPEKIQQAAKCVQKTIRTFDDAYVMGSGEFLASLKHSDAVGGIKFIERLNKILREDGDITFTMSSLVAEPVPGEELPNLLQNMRRDLDKMTGGDSNVVAQFEDISPLARYVQLLKDDPYSG